MDNVIAIRIRDFLKKYPPFDRLPEDELDPVARRVQVRYYQPGELIFRQGEPTGDHIFIVREGAIHLYRESGENTFLVDEYDEGDVFGIRPLLAAEAYAATARAHEETIVYAINVAGFGRLMEKYPKVATYLARNFAAEARSQFEGRIRGRLFLNTDQLIDSHFPLLEVQTIQSSKSPVTADCETSLQKAAAIMSERKVGSLIIINKLGHPKGILTDKDLRKLIAGGPFPLEAPVNRYMNSPVITIAPEMTVADVQILMVRHGIHHLCVTEDGTDDSKAVGVISEHDLMVLQANNPAILIREIGRCHTGEDLRKIRDKAEQLLQKYIFQEVAISFIFTVISEINDAIIARSVELSIEQMEAEGKGSPPADFCWLALGSEGRREQLLRTDQDNALVFADVPPGKEKGIKTWFLDMAQKTNRLLQLTGFAYCPADMMASNTKWCMPFSAWKAQFERWIYQPDPKAIMHTTIFFDYRPVYGNTYLAEELTANIYEDIDEQEIFLAFLAKNALQNPPPLSFFRNFMVEKSGEHKDEFDIKSRAMMPLADTARVLIMQHKVHGINNTVRRFEKLAELEPRNQELYHMAADAYEILMRYRALEGLKNKDSGRFFKPAELNKMQRVNLRNSFEPIDKLQSLLKTRFQLAFIR